MNILSKSSIAILAAGLGVKATPLGHGSHLVQHVIDGLDTVPFTCDLPKPVIPRGDGLPTAEDLFSSKEALRRQVERHSAVVRVPSISYDDGGDVDKDERWEIFFELHKVLEDMFPTV